MATLGDREFRILGRVATKDTINSIFPKFRVVLDNPFEYEVFYSLAEVQLLPSGVRIYEPTKPGLGISREIMYVPTGNKTYLFSVPVLEEVTWGSTTVLFNSGIDFNGQAV